MANPDILHISVLALTCTTSLHSALAEQVTGARVTASVGLNIVRDSMPLFLRNPGTIGTTLFLERLVRDYANFGSRNQKFT